MKTAVTVLSLLLLLAPVRGSAKGDPLDYYRAINAAEMAIAGRNLAKADAYYQRAFAINPDKPFSKDLLNAYYCSMDLKHYANARRYMKALLARGVDAWSIKEFFIRQAKGADLDSIEHWLTLYPNDTLKTDALAVELRKMHDVDQATRAYFSRLNDGKYMVDSVYGMDNQNGNRLAALFAAQGVPNEAKIGHMGNNPIAGPVYSLVALHYVSGYSDKRPSHALDTLLYKAIYTYDYAPVDFVNLYNRSETNVNGMPFSYGKDTIHIPLTVKFIGIDNDERLFPEYYAPAEEKRINKERALLGMPSLDDLRTKAAFRQKAQARKDPYGKYLIVGSIMIMQGESYEEAKPYIEKAQKYKPRVANNVRVGRVRT